MTETLKLTKAELNMVKPKTLNSDGTLLTVSQWAEQYRVVNKGPRQGQWSNEVTPYLTEPMDCLVDPTINELILCTAPQVGKSQVGFNFLCYAIDQDPSDFMIVYPDEKTMRRTAKRKIFPMLRASPVIANQLPGSAQEETIFNVNFKNGMDLYLVWATSASELASESIKYLIFDETDKYPSFSGREADPISLGKIRTNTYGDDAKILYLSTPTTETGAISRAMAKTADQIRHFMAVCPYCGAAQQMTFGSIRWPENVRDPRVILRKKLAWYECVHCQAKWNDHDRDQAVKHGYWEPDQEVDKPRAVGFHLPSWYSPFVSLSKISADFLIAEQARNVDTSEYLAKRYIFVTQHEAKPWKEKKRSADLEELRSYLTDYPGKQAPAGTVALTCGIDMQKDYFLYSVRACGRFQEDSEQWQTLTIDYGRIETWTDLQEFITKTTYPIAGSNKKMLIYRIALDTGGGQSVESTMTRTEESYLFLSKFPPGRVFGTKGASKKPSRSITVSRVDALPHSGQTIRSQVLYLLDTGAFKDLFWERVEDGSHAFAADIGGDYLQQLLAEEKVLERGKYIWKQRGGQANHFFDCEMMHEAMNSSLWKPALQALKTPQGIVVDGELQQETKKPKPRHDQRPSWGDSRPRPSWFYQR